MNYVCQSCRRRLFRQGVIFLNDAQITHDNERLALPASGFQYWTKVGCEQVEIMWRACIFCALIKVIHGGSLGDESDLIIRTIFANYESQAHPNSPREDGAVQVQVGLSPQSYELEESTAVLTSHFWLALVSY